MRYLIIIGFLVSSLFAHEGSSEHIHIFSTMHLESFILFLAGIISTYFVYEKIFKRDN